MSWYREFEHCLRENEPLAAHCWLGLGGAAKYFAEPTTRDELVNLVMRARDAQLPLRLLGSGSNLLIDDAGFAGVVISLQAPEFAQIQVYDDYVIAGGGAQLSHTIVSAVREGLAGLEGLVGIPGTVGGALHGNAGDRTFHVGNHMEQATVVTRSGQLLTRSREEMHFSYRESSLDELAILEACFRLDHEDRDELVRRMQKMWIVTRSKQPGRERRTAHLFKDPMGATASELIEQAGLRGFSHGGVSLFDRDANFIVVQDQARSSDVRTVIDEVQQRVHSQLGIELIVAIDLW